MYDRSPVFQDTFAYIAQSFSKSPLLQALPGPPPLLLAALFQSL